MTQATKEVLSGDFPKESPRRFALQWHLTARCSNTCSHCYLRNTEEEKRELKNEMALGECFKIIDDFHETVTSWNVKGRIYFTGGDPLLKRGIFSLIEYSHKKGIDVGLLGNPSLDYHIAKRLKDLGVFYYQVSIDGLEETHDAIRGKGSFQKTLEAIEILNKVGITSVVMFTLNRKNINELIPVINLVSQKNVSSFDFARLVPIGMGKSLEGDQVIQPQEYRDLLIRVLEEYKRLRKEGSQTFFGRKDNLWKLLYEDLGLSSFRARDDGLIVTGCQMGIAGMTIVSDGTVYVCRRLPIEIGKVPKQKLRDVFIDSKEINEVRDVGKMEKCSKCNLFTFCRGCPAVAYGFTGNYLSPDPQCWKEI